jgi:hypothetical protein
LNYTNNTEGVDTADLEGGMLKSTGTIEDGDGLWYAPNQGATNEFGFNALPAGWRHESGEFHHSYGYGLGGGARFWQEDWFDIRLFFDSVNIIQGRWDRRLGHSIRCIVDEDVANGSSGDDNAACDSDDEDGNYCGVDLDGDGCDDCSGGSFDSGNDGADNDGDGICSATDIDDNCGSNSHDCNGDCDGSAALDSCNDCSGGNSGHVADSAQDCNGDCDGSAALDSCNDCSGGNSGHTTI